jgi:hypothetical protein
MNCGVAESPFVRQYFGVPSLSEEVSVAELSRTVARRLRPGRHSAGNAAAGSAGSIEPDTPRSRPQGRLRLSSPHPADVAQSRLFAELLRSDIDELEERAAAVERRWHWRYEHEPNGAATPPHELRQLIIEARRLLDALHRRFPPD